MANDFFPSTSEPINDKTDGGVPRPGERVNGTLAEVFGFTITDEARETYAKNMKEIDDAERQADIICRTIIL